LEEGFNCIKVLLMVLSIAETGDLLDCSESASCIYVHQVALALTISLVMKDEYLKFPSGEYSAETKAKFFNKYEFPGVLSCIDGTHIKILCPSNPDKKEYRNRKQVFLCQFDPSTPLTPQASSPRFPAALTKIFLLSQIRQL
jgi:hypothetical protein